MRATNDDVCRHDVWADDVWTRDCDCDCDERRVAQSALAPARRRTEALRDASRKPPLIPSVAPGARGNGSLTGATREAHTDALEWAPRGLPPITPCASRGKPTLDARVEI